MNEFWAAIDAQLEELTHAKNADDVIAVLSHERNPDAARTGETCGAEDGFFAGSGRIENTVRDALSEAKWTVVWSKASYYYCMQAPDGSRITYIEGDIRRGDRP